VQPSRELRERIESARELFGLVGAMRSLAAVRARQAQRSMAGIRTYSKVVSGALAQAIPLVDNPQVSAAGAQTPGLLLVALGSQHGFVGAFNDDILDRVESLGAADSLLVVGDRCARIALERGLTADSLSLPTRRDMVDAVVRKLVGRIYKSLSAGTACRVELVFARSERGQPATVVVERLLPLDLASFAPTEDPPLHYLEPGELLERLIEEYVVAVAGRAVMEAFASENWARLTTLDQAHRNLEKKLDQLRMLERRLRQEEITTELIDLVTGTKAVLGKKETSL
jgi:F-type H+-transporting ATPase subunit gamma